MDNAYQAADAAKLFTCKDCPYWDDAPLRHTSADSIGYCRYDAPRAGTSSERDFPVTWDNDWCRPGCEAMEQHGAHHIHGPECYRREPYQTHQTLVCELKN